MAKTNTSDVAESNGPRVIAEWVGSNAALRLDRFTARTISQKEAKNGLLMDLTRDLRWGHETAYRADVTDEPEAFKEWLKGQSEFKVTEE